MRKPKTQTRKHLFKSIKNGERHKNTELQDKAEKVERSEGAAQIIGVLDQITRSKSKNNIWLAYQQGKVLFL